MFRRRDQLIGCRSTSPATLWKRAVQISAPRRVGAHKMVPRAVRTHLDDVAREMVVRSTELAQPLRRINNPAAVSLELVTKNVLDSLKGVVRANRTPLGPFLADVLRGPNEFRVGVANVASVERPASQRCKHGSTRQAVIDNRPRELRGPDGGVKGPARNRHAKMVDAFMFVCAPERGHRAGLFRRRGRRSAPPSSTPASLPQGRVAPCRGRICKSHHIVVIYRFDISTR